MTAADLIVLSSFYALLLLSLRDRRFRQALRRRSGLEWLLDGTGLIVQGILIPVLKIAVVVALWRWFAPTWKASWHVSDAAAFLLSFVGVDYLYYWNHRFLHGRWLWRHHFVHHTAKDLDLLVTSRNSLHSSLLILYVWVQGTCIFLLADPRWFILGAAMTAALDLWRHTRLWPASPGVVASWLERWLITPRDHAWHHSSSAQRVNFGANLKLWDRMHGTYLRVVEWPEALGIAMPAKGWRNLFYPFASRRS